MNTIEKVLDFIAWNVLCPIVFLSIIIFVFLMLYGILKARSIL